MSIVSSPVTSTTARPVSLRVRPDLKFERQVYQGEVSWVVKDPIALKYFRLPEEEYAVLKLLDGETTLDTIKETIERDFAPIIIEFAELQSLLGMFHQYGLVISMADGQGEQLFERRQKVRRQQMMGKLASVLWIKLPGFDPERMLSWMYPKLRWFYSRWCFVLCILMSLSAMLLVTINIESFYRKLPHFHEFFSFPNIIWMMAAMGVAKVIHEFGHGLTCKHYGGECHEIGVMFLVFTPCLYCDTSDSWMLKSKWQRAAIGAGGMYVEIVMAAIATFIWWNTEEGMLHFLALSTMFVCSVSTVIFNSNPLLRYDGYYILSDILEVPNLAQKSRNALLGLLRHYCLGMPWNEQQMALPPRDRFWFALYSIASTVYRWMVLVFILWFLSKVFEPYGLQALGHILICMSLFGVIVMPMWKTFKFFRVPGRMRQVKKIRLFITAALVAGLIAAIALIPIPHRVITTLVSQPRGAKPVYVYVPGTYEQYRLPVYLDRTGETNLQINGRKNTAVAESDAKLIMRIKDALATDPTLKSSVRIVFHPDDSAIRLSEHQIGGERKIYLDDGESKIVLDISSAQTDESGDVLLSQLTVQLRPHIDNFLANKLEIKPGTEVKKGDQLAVLVNPMIDREIARLKDEIEFLRKEIGNHETRFVNAVEDEDVDRMDSLISQTRSRRQGVIKELAKRVDEQRRLTLFAPTSGHILPPPDLPDQPDEENLPSWTGSPLDPKNKGCMLETGTLFCMVGDPNKMEVVMIIDQSDMEFIKKGQRVDIKFDEYPNEVITTEIEQIAKIDLKYAPRELGTEAQGELTTKRDKSGREKPLNTSYQARAEIKNFDGELLQGFRGRAKIHTGSKTLGQMLVRYLWKTFRFG